MSEAEEKIPSHDFINSGIGTQEEPYRLFGNSIEDVIERASLLSAEAQKQVFVTVNGFLLGVDQDYRVDILKNESSLPLSTVRDIAVALQKTRRK